MRFHHLALLCLLLLSPRMGAPGGALAMPSQIWEPVGPEGGTVTALALDPHDPDGVWAVTETGLVFRGTVQRDLAAGSPEKGPGGAGEAPVVMPGPVFWQLRGRVPAADAIGILAPHPEVAGRLVASTPDRFRHFLSEDGGGSWEELDFGHQEAFLVPASPSLVLRQDAQGRLERSTDLGETWQSVEGVPGDRHLAAVLGDPSPDGPAEELWALLRPSEPSGGEPSPAPVLRSRDGGATWTGASTGLPAAGAPGGTEAYSALALAGGRLVVSTRDGRIFASDDGGDSWSARGGPIPDGLRLGGPVEALVVDAGDPSLLYLRLGTGAFGHLVVSRDGGSTFAPPDALPRPQAPTVLPLPWQPGAALVGLVAEGVWLGEDGLEGARPARAGLRATEVREVAVLEGGSPGLFAVASHLLWSSDRGTDWESLTLPLLGGQGSPLVWDVAPGLRDRLYAGDGFDILRSDDRGATWEMTPGRIGCLLPTLVEVAPSSAETLMTSGGFQSFGCATLNLCALLRSEDGGESYECVRGELGEGGSPDPAGVPNVTHELAFDPRDDRVVYAGLGVGALARSLDGGESWEFVLPGSFEEVLYGGVGRIRDVLVPPAAPDQVWLAAEDGVWRSPDRGVWRLERQDVSPCVPGPTVLCLQGGRFEVTASWEDFEGGRGLGQAQPEGGDSGWFWFFDQANVELLVKVLDGRVINRHFWVFYGSLSNVAYRLRLRDAATGEVLDFDNPAGRFASAGETAAFPRPRVPEPKVGVVVPGAPRAEELATAGAGVVDLAPLQSPASTSSTPAPVSCEPGPETLCLQGGRFRVRVSWRDFQGGRGAGRAVPETDDSGFFWFFEEDNLELVVKVLDARPLEPRFWVFYGALSNVAYEIRVLDTVSGREKVYRNPEGHFGSLGDTGTFPVVGFCGGIAGFPCLEGQVCDPEAGSCQVADVGGRCRTVPDGCPEIFQPVCGCDGRTYVNDCERLQAGVAKDHDGACGAGP